MNPRAKPYKFSNQKLKDLGLEFTPAKQCLYDTVKCLQEKGHLPLPLPLPLPSQQDQDQNAIRIQSWNLNQVPNYENENKINNCTYNGTMVTKLCLFYFEAYQY